MPKLTSRICRAARCKADSFLTKVAAAYMILAALILIFNESDG